MLFWGWIEPKPKWCARPVGAAAVDKQPYAPMAPNSILFRSVPHRLKLRQDEISILSFLVHAYPSVSLFNNGQSWQSVISWSSISKTLSHHPRIAGAAGSKCDCQLSLWKKCPRCWIVNNLENEVVHILYCNVEWNSCTIRRKCTNLQASISCTMDWKIGVLIRCIWAGQVRKLETTWNSYCYYYKIENSGQEKINYILWLTRNHCIQAMGQRVIL